MSTIWSDTIQLMLMGMGTVFVFLVVLIVSLNIMSSVIAKVVPVEAEQDNNTAAGQEEIAAVAAIAFAKYKN